MWFITKVKYNKEDERGLLKQVSEQYLVDADSFTEAETRIYSKLEEMVKGYFDVTDISKTNYVDVFEYEDGDYWHKCKVQLHMESETGKEKKVTQHVLVNASTVKEAYDRVNGSLGEVMVTFSVPDVIETKILEVFRFEKVLN